MKMLLIKLGTFDILRNRVEMIDAFENKRRGYAAAKKINVSNNKFSEYNPTSK
jgi:hypothetical protein